MGLKYLDDAQLMLSFYNVYPEQQQSTPPASPGEPQSTPPVSPAIPFTRNMKAMIKSGDWLSDEHMYLAQAILQKHFPAIDGWQSTLLAQVDGIIPATNESIQTHLVSENHWVTSSSLGHEVVVYMTANYVGEN